MFKRFFKTVFKKKITLLFILISTFALGVFMGAASNQINQEYEIAFKSNLPTETFNNILDLDTLNKIKDSNEKFANINTAKIVENKAIKIEYQEEIYKLTTKANYYDDFFLSSSKTVSTRAKTFIKSLILEFDENATFLYPNIYITKNSVSIYLIGGITSGVGLLAYLIYLLVNQKKLSLEEETEHQQTPFSLSYWKESIKSFTKTKSLVTIAMLFALMMVCKMFSIPTGFANLNISFTFVFFALICMLYGPITGLIIGAFSDILGFFLFPNGPTFFFGYVIQASLTGFIYGLCLYKQKFSFSNAFFARFLVNMFMNVIWGSICFGILYNYDVSTTMSYMLVYSLPKNLIYLLPQTLVLYLVLKATTPILKRLNYLK